MAGTETLPEAAPGTTPDVSDDSLAKIQNAVDKIDWDAEPDATDDGPVADEPTATAGDTDDEQQEIESKGEESAKTDEQPKQTRVDLNPLQLLALKHHDIDTEDVAAMGPTKAKRFADKLIERRNKETEFFGTVGSKLGQMREKSGSVPQQSTQQQPATSQNPQQHVERADANDGISDEQIQQTFGLPSADQVLDQFGDEAIESIHKPMMQMGRMMLAKFGGQQAPADATASAAQPQAQPVMPASPNGQNQNQVALTAINTFFDSMASNGFGDQYGNGAEGWQNATTRVMRERVLQKADELSTQAAAAGVNLSTDDALNRAHFSEMQPHLIQQAEQRGRAAGIEEQSRKNNATMNPPGRTRRPGEKPKNNDQAVYNAVKAKYDQLGLGDLGDDIDDDY